MINDLVSVVVPAHNYGHLIGECLKSVIAQSHKDLEIIVIDDSSADNTKEVVAGFPSVKYYNVKHQGCRTPAFASNFGLSVCSGKHIIFLAADDLLSPCYVEMCLSFYRHYSALGRRVGLVWTGCQEFEGARRVRIPRLASARGVHCFYANPGGQLGAMLVPRSVYDTVGGYDMGLVGLEDWDFALRVLKAGFEAVSVPLPLHFARVHQGRVTDEAVLSGLYRKHRLMRPYLWLRRFKRGLWLLFSNPLMLMDRLWRNIIK